MIWKKRRHLVLYNLSTSVVDMKLEDRKMQGCSVGDSFRSYTVKPTSTQTKKSTHSFFPPSILL